jgi:hypothetical protein
MIQNSCDVKENSVEIVKKLIMMFMMLCCIGCITIPVDTSNLNEIESSMKLSDWVDKKLSPYLAKKLGRHPKFQGQPFMIVKMKEENIESSIDDLTREIRDQLDGKLKSSSGVNLVWRPSATGGMGTSLPEICYYIGIDMSLAPVDGRLRMRVGALNIKEKKWEDSFFLSWQGKATKNQLKALSRFSLDTRLSPVKDSDSVESENMVLQTENNVNTYQDSINTNLISDFELMTPVASSLCQTKTPWLLGKKNINKNDSLATGACLAMTLTLHSSGYIYLFNQNPEGEITTLFPNKCDGFSMSGNFLEKGDKFRFPPEKNCEITAIDIMDNPGKEIVYAVVINNLAIAKRFENKIASLQGLCEPGQQSIQDNPFKKVAKFQYFLGKIQKTFKGNVDWQIREFNHIEPVL